MRKWSIETLSLAGMGAVLALLAALGALVWHNMAESKRTGLQVEHAHARISWLEQVRADLYRADSEQQRDLNYPDPGNLARRDAMLALLDLRLEPDSGLDGKLPASWAHLRDMQESLHPQMARQPADQHRNSGNHFDRIVALIDNRIGQERAVLNRVKRDAARQNLESRGGLAVLLLSMALLTMYILLKIRRMTLGRKMAHARLLEGEIRYRQIVDTAHEGIWQTDTDGRILLLNRRMEEMLGYSADELLGRRISDLFDAAILQRVCPLHAGEAVRPMRDLRYQRKDGSPAWAIVGGRLLYDDGGAVSGALVMATDITERKRAEQALSIAHAELENRIRLRTAELLDANEHLLGEIAVRKAAEQALARSEERLQEIIAMMPLALFLKDAESNIVLMNQACEHQWGVSFAELSSQPAHMHFPPEQMAGFRADDRTAFAGRRLLVLEKLVWNSRLQENRLVQTYKKPIFDADGKPLMLIAMGIDITERKRNEEALQQSFIQLRELSDHQETIKEEERKRIALDIHDDLGQNLMALKIDVAMLHARSAGHPRLNRQVQRALDTIDATIKSVRVIINDLHPSTLELGLSAAVEWLLRQLEQRSAIRFQLTILDDSASASLDQRQTSAIFRAIQESLSNIMRHARASEVEVSLKLSASRIAIVIADNGIGMQPGDPGKAASYGLKSIRERVGAFGGELLIDSRKDSGTVLSILMPVMPQGAQQPAAHR